MSRNPSSRPLRLCAGICASLMLGALAGCATSSGTSQSVDPRPVAAASRPAVTEGQYRVRRGDTLYAIATRHGWDWQSLARHNGIEAPYTLRVGQVIRFGSGTAGKTPQATAVTSPAPVAVPPAQPVVAAPPVASPATAAPATSSTSASSAPPKVSPSGWGWPANGQLISLYSSNSSLNKGIDIGGDLGQPVYAASTGNVVYAGSGLRGYGELVIIKHNDTYVSAYGHNHRLLVREGQRVKAGEKIAEMGSTGTDRVKLHFEIRRQGKPVDPLQYLPRR
ncbi:peptidoglycan DD-metalloendopeptidase family protein [Pseudomonas oryzae]|uniref:Lipoprotein NlpD n=1 Tax=Pseudomonas oryzae TaxID=1392877 RepID=A0A1H1SZH8_9PSED|nr:lipoprotein NlpD [Pseudomonas oryzae]